ncbi:Protein of unknown function DUF1064 [uncultured Caudovirales phage]|uniref:DUF1064 domain-containing protein n=1 Tax=uncultured Caudovirales phage TaxID=2100421 RepID=A0A6J5QDC4_9CAUD|nr:Protein of unknown function DUF1064 [uncultured Caudovirales phage]
MAYRKYSNERTLVGGIMFASKAEAARYSELLLLERAGAISGIECHPRFALVVNGCKIATYVADFRYLDKRTGLAVVEDVKGVQTAVFKLKYKLVRALHGIDIVLIGRTRKKRVLRPRARVG